MIKRLIFPSALLGALLVSGCAASLSPDPAFQNVAVVDQERTGKRIEWDSGSDEDQRVRSHIDHMPKKQSSASRAVQIALLNNRKLQASYASLGVAHCAARSLSFVVDWETVRRL
jgi:cobalt-zinc-cadmium efflux system outer membrane protein